MFFLIGETESLGVFYVGPFHSEERAIKAMDACEKAGIDVAMRLLEPWTEAKRKQLFEPSRRRDAPPDLQGESDG